MEKKPQKKKGGFIPVQKTKAYFKRFQTKFRRRREGKTDYKARRRLVTQNKTKFNCPKYRFVVRITNRDVICQIVYSKLVGDQVLESAYASELPRYGIKCGLTNYAATYATGLLLARRLLNKLGLDTLYEGLKVPDGNYYLVEEKEGERRPFQAFLDIGLARNTNGAKIFAALKGAVDGGIEIPHSARSWPGYDRDEDIYDPAKHRERIYGIHVGRYMKELKEESPDKYANQFSQYIKNGVSGGDLEAIYTKAHAAIRADPKRKARKPYTGPKTESTKKTKFSLKQRRARAAEKKAKILKKLSQDS